MGKTFSLHGKHDSCHVRGGAQRSCWKKSSSLTRPNQYSQFSWWNIKKPTALCLLQFGLYQGHPWESQQQSCWTKSFQHSLLGWGVIVQGAWLWNQRASWLLIAVRRQTEWGESQVSFCNSDRTGNRSQPIQRPRAGMGKGKSWQSFYSLFFWRKDSVSLLHTLNKS